MNWSLIDYYREIEQTSRRMVEAARIGNWEQVGELEAVCEGLISLIHQFAPSPNLSADERAEKADMMKRILAMDAEIRSLMSPLATSFDHAFDSTGHTIH